MVKYADGDFLEQSYRADLRCEALMTFYENRRELFHVTMDYRSAKAYEKTLNAQDIYSVRPCDTVYRLSGVICSFSAYTVLTLQTKIGKFIW
jgi:hypothetical protein